ncbi:MAG: hypothetical protein V3V14_04145 [Saprospiraceae bacterium]
MQKIIFSKYAFKPLLKYMFFLSVLLCFSFRINAQSKPSRYIKSSIVNPQTLLSETYLDFAEKKDSPNDYLLNTRLRYGISSNWELQYQWSGYQNGKQYSTIGVKTKWIGQRKLTPAISTIATANLTVNRNTVSVSPALNVLLEKSLLNNLTVFGYIKTEIDFNDNSSIFSYAGHLEMNIIKWLDLYLGYTKNTAQKWSDGFDTNSFEIGTMLWIRKGLSVMPYYQFDSFSNITDRQSINFALLYNI